MKALKLQRLKIVNFKLFDDIEIDFSVSESPSDIFVLDGANGFGKTTVFDAIELLFTGKIQRICRAAENIVKSNSFKDPLLCKDREKPFVILKLEMLLDGEVICIARRLETEKLTGNRLFPDDFSGFEFFELPSYDAPYTDWKAISNEKEYIESLTGTLDLERFFSLFYYIEQEDSLAFLRMSERDRKKFISELFDTKKEEDKLERLTSTRKRLLKQNRDLIQKIRRLEELIQNQEASREGLKQSEETSYTRVLEELDKERIWDSKELMIKDNSNRLAYHKLIDSLIDFLDTFQTYKKVLHNRTLDRYSSDKELLASVITYSGFINTFSKVKINYKKERALEQALEKIQRSNLTATLINHHETILKIAKDVSHDLTDFDLDDLVKKVKHLDSNSDQLSKIFSRLTNNRSELWTTFLSLTERKLLSDSECPLCGSDWKSFDGLLRAVEKEEQELSKLIQNESAELNRLVDEFYKSHVADIMNKAETFLADKESRVSKSFYSQVQKGEEFHDRILAFNKWVEENNFSVESFVNRNENVAIKDVSSKVDELSEFLESMKFKSVKVENIKDDFDHIYREYFDSQELRVSKLSKDSLEEKKKYIDYLFLKQSSKSFEETKKKIDKLNQQLKAVNGTNEKLGIAIESIKAEIATYRGRIIKDIEIPFYLYSGRILQNSQRGLGLFIQEGAEGALKSIKFLSQIDSDHDALFSLSSGQLSALIISFTLALNKLYSKNTLLLIDDPIQTMDDINVASFVELLRNEFNDKQIVLSTHEERLSLYLQYKFRKLGRVTGRASVKDKVFEARSTQYQ